MKPLLLPLGYLLAGASLLGQARSPDSESNRAGGWVIERWDREEKLPPVGLAVEIENSWGDLRVRGSSVASLRFHAVAQAPDPLGIPQLELATTERGWTYRIRLPESPGVRPKDVRLDLAIELPAGRAVDLVTDGGLIEVRGLEAPLGASSRSGPIDVRGPGPVQLRNQHGPVRWAVHPRLAEGPSRLETSTGAIELELPEGAGAHVSMTTQGHFTTDFSLEVLFLGPLTKRGRTTIEGGGPRLELQSETGDLKLLRRPRARPANRP